ncbi:MAG TPA: sigma factor [Gemmataceae bacterium]|nr:sigma factor [Gemmataceae bacterium]
MSADPFDDQAPANGRHFASTHWSVVAAAAQRWSPEARQALETLCQTYWYPLYTYARRRLANADDARDLTQSFFVRLLEKDYLQAADPKRGRFRSFLLTAFMHFLAKERDHAQAQKRGGGRQTISFDFQAGERRYTLEPVDRATPEALFERRWALTILEQAMARLRQEFVSAGKAALFDALKGALAGDGTIGPYGDVANQLGMSEQAIKVAVHRLRRRYRELLRAEIAQTVDRPEEVDEELHALFAAVRGGKR